uniref:NADH-ubiquinone oxidoreductase chain 6 n=1 Tax=Plateumaris sericea TaxID=225723 RepID=A0A3G1GSZ3_PLASE|nr:NADH dehydrogenase subunit 6 [Plateumaris sericea]
MLILLMCWSSILFIFMKHPLSLGLILLIQTFLIALISGLMSQTFWFSYILFLVMIGGMLVLFMYMNSIASNEKFKFSMNLMIMTISMISLTILISNFESFFFNLNIHISEIFQQFNKMNYYKNFNKYMNYPLNMIIYMIILYLFITLIMTTKLTMIGQGPLRQNN